MLSENESKKKRAAFVGGKSRKQAGGDIVPIVYASMTYSGDLAFSTLA